MGCLAFFRVLVARGLKGTMLVTSDGRSGLVAAIGGTPPGATCHRLNYQCKGLTLATA